MDLNQDVAAHNLVGKSLENDWIVKRKIEKGGTQTGAHFSVGYIVEKDGKESFLKAFNISAFSNGTFMERMKEMSDAYSYEKDLSDHCRSKHVNKVSFVIDYGEISLSGYTFPVVPYLIFELADGDIRAAIDFTDNLNTSWKFHSLHEIAIGLKQLHTINVSHQDLKPSNILVYNGKKDSKICDLGRSACLDIPSIFTKIDFTGDLNYSPPEYWYKYHEKDWKKRTFAIDCYMLGSLITFYFAGNSMSSLLMNFIPIPYHPTNWAGTFDEIEPYIQDAFSKALEEFSTNFKDEFYKEDLINLVSQLCNPFPSERGHPKNLSNLNNQYSLERFISKLDHLKHKFNIQLKRS